VTEEQILITAEEESNGTNIQELTEMSEDVGPAAKISHK
jgi:hypothetical protein